MYNGNLDTLGMIHDPSPRSMNWLGDWCGSWHPVHFLPSSGGWATLPVNSLSWHKVQSVPTFSMGLNACSAVGTWHIIHWRTDYRTVDVFSFTHICMTLGCHTGLFFCCSNVFGYHHVVQGKECIYRNNKKYNKKIIFGGSSNVHRISMNLRFSLKKEGNKFLPFIYPKIDSN